ncbi:MAG TPA: hypothetical protein VNX46_10925, partial [Candidatus Acidoferrum sp.]|nr:hypothetical protein [Candidatus Acidoferrum sp.]
MNTNNFPKYLTILAIAGLSALSLGAGAQQTAVTTATPPAVSSSTPQLPYGVAQILQLSQAKVSDDTIVAYVRNSGNSYGLDANQIIFLRQQGVSDPVITAMLNQPKAGVMAASEPPPSSPTAAAPADQTQATVASSGGSTAAYVSTATVAPTVTYVQSVPTYYSSYPYYYGYGYPYYRYGYYPGVSISLGYGGWYGGGYRYYGGGWGGGGYHYGGGGGWHGGGGGGWHGGG